MTGEAAMMESLAGRRVWVSGHRGMVGSAIVRRLARENCEILTVGRDEVDLTKQEPTRAWIERSRPDLIFVAAARVGGILANATYPADFLYDNLMIAANIMSSAREAATDKLIWLGSSCVYPRDAAQPIREESLLTGSLEPTNEAYAIAKIAGVMLARAYARQFGCRFITAMPTNLYGINDNFDPQTAHVLPALVGKIHEAKERGLATVTLWGSGRPLREFLHVDDLADACVFLAKRYDDASPINIGSGQEISIRDLAGLIAEVIGYEGSFVMDRSKPDGTPRKLLDTTKMERLGWRPTIPLGEGIRELYRHWQARSENSSSRPPDS
jgi:GDP-L-fucose synthase